jgi:hypothetical protein
VAEKPLSDMTLADLDRLPVVNVVWQPRASFTAPDGVVWNVGIWQGAWAKAPAPVRSPAATPQTARP